MEFQYNVHANTPTLADTSPASPGGDKFQKFPG